MPKLPPLEEQRLLVRVSKLYYEEGCTQDDIIARLDLSRSKISRLLQQARARGIVQITVVTPGHVFSDLENELERRFGLKEALVVEARSEDTQDGIARTLGIAAAAYLERLIRPTTALGISWGTTLSGMVAALRTNHLPKSKVVQVIGGLGRPESEVHATDLCRRLARSLGSQLILLPAPGIVANKKARDVLMSDRYVRRATEMFGHLDIVFVGIGAPSPHSVVMRDGSIISQDELKALLQDGAAGDIALHFFDEDGEPVQSEIDNRSIGITLAQLKSTPRVVGVAGGPEKHEAVLGALRGKLINVLITDSITATRILR